MLNYNADFNRILARMESLHTDYALDKTDQTGATDEPFADGAPDFAQILDTLKSKLPQRSKGWMIESSIDKASRSTGLDPKLLRAVIARESGGDPDAVSAAGAKGLMQLMDSVAAEQNVRNSYDPEENVMAGARHLKGLLGKYKGDLSLALAAYNAGSGAVDRYKGIPPFAETQKYVRAILADLGGGSDLPSGLARGVKTVDFLASRGTIPKRVDLKRSEWF